MESNRCEVLHDVSVASAERWSSKSWYREGFCVSVTFSLSSHGWSCLLDLLFGLALLFFNARPWPSSVGGQLAALVSLFTLMHGLAHGALGHFEGFDEEFLDQLRPQRAPCFLALSVLLALSAFLAIGPFVGYVHGVRVDLCVAIHLTCLCQTVQSLLRFARSMLLFVLYVPLQFAFGAVQLASWHSGWWALGCCSSGSVCPSSPSRAWSWRASRW